MKKLALPYYAQSQTGGGGGGPTVFTATWQTGWPTQGPINLMNEVQSRTLWSPGAYDVLRIVIPEYITFWRLNTLSTNTPHTNYTVSTGTISGAFDLEIELRGNILGGGGSGGYGSSSPTSGFGKSGMHGLWVTKNVHIDAYPDQYNRPDSQIGIGASSFDYRKCGGFICGGGGGGGGAYDYTTYTTKRSSGRYSYYSHGGGGMGGGREGYFLSYPTPTQSTANTNGTSVTSLVGRHYNNVDVPGSTYGTYGDPTFQYGLPGNAGGGGGLCAGVNSATINHAYGSSGGYNPSQNIRYAPFSSSTTTYLGVQIGQTASVSPHMTAGGVGNGGQWAGATVTNFSEPRLQAGVGSGGRANRAGNGGGGGQSGGPGQYNGTAAQEYAVGGIPGKAIVTNGYLVTHNQVNFSDFCYGSVSSTYT